MGLAKEDRRSGELPGRRLLPHGFNSNTRIIPAEAGGSLDQDTRETFTSTWGTILATAGVAIGLGNIWRFPYMMGIFGGATFLIIYLFIVLAFGIPSLMAEWAVGRHTRRGPLGAFERAGMPGGRWWGYLLLLTVTMAVPYYSVVIGWVLYYAFLFLTSQPPTEPQAAFDSLVGRLGPQFICVVITLAASCLSLYFGVKNGIERVSKLVLPLFFLLFVVLMVRSLTLEGAMEGVRYYLLPRLDQFTSRTVLAAMGQAFFSLGLGGTFMVIYGSYMRREEQIPRTAVFTVLADVSAALLAGFIVVPAVFAFDIDMASGPSLLFVVMPEVFRRLPLGGFFGATFFVSVFLIALLSLIAAYEVLVAALQDVFGWARGRALAVILVVELVLALPAMRSLNYVLYSDLIWGSTMQPLGAVIAVVALAWSMRRAKALEEIGRNTSLPVPNLLYYWIKYVIPVGILVTLIYGWTGA